MEQKQMLEVQELPQNADTAMVPAVHLPIWQSAIAWFLVLPTKQKIAIAAGSTLSLILVATVVPRLLSGKSATVDPPRMPAANPSAVLNAAGQSYEQLAQNTALVVMDSKALILAQEGERLSLYAKQETTDPKSRCYRKAPGCVLDRLESEAIAQFDRETKVRNWSGALTALNRVHALDMARQGNQLAKEPAASLTTLAMRNRLELRSQLESASFESLSSDIVGGVKK